jgi:hypothetical protein
LPDLRRVLADHDLAFLRQAAALWGHDLAAASQRDAVDELAAWLLNPAQAALLTDDLPPAARAALESLARDGRQPLPQFTRRHGELRAMGPARREREKPWANDPSTTETLWYRALIGRAFFDEGRGPEEFIFLPDDLRALVWVGPVAANAAAVEPPGRPLGWTTDDAEPRSAAERNRRRATKDEGRRPEAVGRPAADEAPAAEGTEADEGRRTIDAEPAAESRATHPATLGRLHAAHDIVTLLAYLQVHTVRPEAPADPHAPARSQAHLPPAHLHTVSQHLLQPAALPLYLHLIQHLGLAAAGPGREPFKLDPNKVQPFLQAAPEERLRPLAEAWRDARDWNDLLHVPGLTFEGTAWRNDPLTARQAILGLLRQVPPEMGWDLGAFVVAVRERQPDFQRPAGDYDSWYIRDLNGQYLRGFDNWDKVDGALVRWLIAHPLRWLGLVDVTEGDPPAGFRLTRYGAALLGQTGWDAADPAEMPALDLAATGEVRVPAAASAHDRFQLARISHWLPPVSASAGVAYVYRLTPAALARAAAKGITAARILQFLERAAPSHPALPGLAAALLRWERSGAEAALHDTLVLKLADPALLETLRRLPHLRDWLGPALGPGLVTVRREHAASLRAALAELGILLDGD